MKKSVQNLLKKITETPHRELKDPNDRILLIDGLNNYIRTFSGTSTTNEDGDHIGGMTGFLMSIGYAIKTLNPTRCIIVFDGKGGSSRRRKKYANYKDKRATTRFNRKHNFHSLDQERKLMGLQLNRLAQYLDTLPVTIMSHDHVEADDVIGYLAAEVFNKEGCERIIMSTDKDFIQLINKDVRVWSPTKKKLYTIDNVEEDYGFPAHNYLMFRIMDGDDSDNIKGVRGIGKGTVQKWMPFLLSENKVTVDQLIEFAEKVDSKAKIYEKVRENKDVLNLNYELMQLDSVNISGKTKLKVLNQSRNIIPRLNKTRFLKLALEDKIQSAIRNIDVWINNAFGRLDYYAGLTEENNDR